MNKFSLYNYGTALIKKKSFIMLIVCLPFLNSCGIWDPAPAKDVPTNVTERAQKSLEEGKGISIGKLGSKGSGNFEFATSNVMWRATLEILEFLPLANVDYGGGIISTDWYNEGTSNDESIKITVRFLSNEIRADGIRIIVHKKACNKTLNCTIKKISSVLEEELTLANLREATLPEQDVLKKNRKEYKKKYGEKRRRKQSQY